VLLAGLVVEVAERCVVVLEGAHLLELLLHPASPLDGDLDQLRHVIPRNLAVGVDHLDQAGNGLAYRLAVASVEVGAEPEVLVEAHGEEELAQLTQGAGQVVDHQAVVVGEQLVAHLRHLPAR